MKNSGRERFVHALFILYCLMMLWLLFHRAHWEERSFNLVPLRTIRGYFEVFSRFGSYGSGMRMYAVVNFGGNILLFTPMGMFLPLLFEKERRFPVFFLTVVLIITAVESVQYLTYTGAMDVDDLFLNTLGAGVGYLIWRWEARAESGSGGPSPDSACCNE